jgi:hypothetical protein
VLHLWTRYHGCSDIYQRYWSHWRRRRFATCGSLHNKAPGGYESSDVHYKGSGYQLDLARSTSCLQPLDPCRYRRSACNPEAVNADHTWRLEPSLRRPQPMQPASISRGQPPTPANNSGHIPCSQPLYSGRSPRSQTPVAPAHAARQQRPQPVQLACMQSEDATVYTTSIQRMQLIMVVINDNDRIEAKRGGSANDAAGGRCSCDGRP